MKRPAIQSVHCDPLLKQYDLLLALQSVQNTLIAFGHAKSVPSGV